MTDLELWIKRHHRRLAFGLFLQRAGEGLAVFLFLFGAAVLIAKLFLPQFWPHVLWLGVLVVPVVILAARFANRTSFSRTEAVALLDRQLKGGGLIMALAESNDPQWHSRLPKTPELWRRKLPKVWPQRFFRLIGWPMVFAVGALLIPLRNPHPAMGFSPAVGQQATRQLGNLIGLLEVAHVLAPEETKELKSVVELLSQETENTPLSSERWETIDHLRKTLTEKLAENETAIAQASQVVAKVLEAQDGNLEELLAANKLDLRKVGEVLESLNQKGAIPELPTGLGPELAALIADGQHELAKNPELRRQVFGQLQSVMQTRAFGLRSVRSQFDNVFSRMPNPISQEKQTSTNTSSVKSPDEGNHASPEGLFKWGAESEQKQAKFKQVVLPPNLVDPDTNSPVGTEGPNHSPRRVTPSENVSAELPTQFDPSASGEIRSRELRPRHRAAVKKYFQQESTNPPTKSNNSSTGE